jgi:hypothetical protein
MSPNALSFLSSWWHSPSGAGPLAVKCSFLLWCLALFTSPLDAELRAGAAVRIVTPDPLLPVSGGVGPSHPTARKEGDLTVRALVLADGPALVVMVSSDFLGFPAVLGNKVRSALPAIPPENILMGATHTHSAPDCYGFRDSEGKTAADLKYLDGVCQRMVEAIREAVEKLRPASLKIATGEAKGKIAYNYYAEQLYDPRCHVLQAVGDDGKPLATLVNYAVHPEVLGSEEGITSPDLVGPLCDRIEEAGGGTCIFFNGALGGMVTADNRGPGGKDLRAWGECVRIGRLLADEALRIVASAPEQKSPKLSCAARRISFPVDSPLLLQVMKSSPLGFEAGGDGRSVSTQLNLVNVGNAQILTIPGEALPNIGYYLKRKMHGQHNFLFGLTNDAFGYILARADWGSFKRYDYITRTCLGEMTGEILMEEAVKLIAACPEPDKLAP